MRQHFKRSLAADYFSEKELSSLIGCSPEHWHLTILKELIDNSLDAAEQVAETPSVEITIDAAGTLIVEDNGQGIPAEVVDGSLDFDYFVSDKNGRIAPSRGQLGNALKILFAVPLVVDGQTIVEIISQGLHHNITLAFDELTGLPVATKDAKDTDVQNGTFFKIHRFFKSRLQTPENEKRWPKSTNRDISTLIRNFAMVNHHAEFVLNIAGQQTQAFFCSEPITRWTADKSLVPHWHNPQQLKNLMQLTFGNMGNISVNQFLGQFNGLKQSGKQKALCDATGINSKDGIEVVLRNDHFIRDMLSHMKENSRQIKPNVLGGLSPEHVCKQWCDNSFQIHHKKANGYTTKDRPFVLDVFFQHVPSHPSSRVIALNNSVLLNGDIKMLDWILDDIFVDWDDPVWILIHVSTPYVEFHSKGKNSISFDSAIFTALEKKLTAAAKDFTRLKKKELKGLPQKQEPVTPKKDKVLPSPKDKEGLKVFADILKGLQAERDFKTGVRGWCYLLEDAIGLHKSDFKKAEARISLCRKTGLLPYDFTAADENRKMLCGDHEHDKASPEDFFKNLIFQIQHEYLSYHPINLHDFLDTAIVVAVEKSDLVELFRPVCKQFHVPLFNCKGWSDINSRCSLLLYMKKMKQQGKNCLVLYCGDHDPGGLNISDGFKKNLNQLEQAVGFSSDFIQVERFGLNYDFIEQHGLSWIENLDTSSANTPSLDNPKHPDHYKPYVQDYISEFGVRKCEANSLVVQHEAGRQLLRDTLLKHIKLKQISEYEKALDFDQAKVKALLKDQFAA